MSEPPCECAECGGTGYVLDVGTGWVECEACEGDGDVTAEPQEEP